ncbi:MAG: diguanylate cyclase [Aquabacterium sp.]|uniref:diguanylate cyclase n=1 Tax=Aquabacterium sp. TaxID=1872578 RepID=UPI0027287615|nr:diguanylate cyclase [Aquabacterium sp.]MDO9003668.1 diguanylate cyclase [Aquabacterium sp.]
MSTPAHRDRVMINTGTWGVWLLGEDWKQRVRILRCLGGGVVYLLVCLLMNWVAAHGYLPTGPVLAISGAIGVTTVVFYAVLRSKLNLRFRDASLTMPQMVLAVTYAAWVYTMGGPARDVMLFVLVPLLLYGFRYLRSLQVRLLSAYVIVAMGAAMVWLLHAHPHTYDMAQELLRFMLLAVIGVTLSQFTKNDGEEASGFLQTLMHLVFSSDPKQRLRIQRYMVAAVNFVICTVVLAYSVSVGAVNETAGWALGAYMMGSCLLFYGLLRSGFNLRFADPSLTLPQIMVAITCVVGAYAILEESRGASLMLLVLVLVFGLFNLTASQARSAAFFALVAQGLTMLAMNALEPGRYPVRQELIHFLFACTTLPTISLLAGQLSDLRSRLRARKDELAIAVERIQTLATRDELTGLFNRRHMVETLSLQKKFSDRGGRVFCIGILDIDHFKRVNDTHGHGAGDEVLRNFAHTVQHELRESDVIARWGGEEFLLMLTECRVGQADAMMERVREVVNNKLMCPEHPELHIRFSAGLAEQRFDEEVADTIERADQALYRAKRAGRNRTVLAS